MAVAFSSPVETQAILVSHDNPAVCPAGLSFLGPPRTVVGPVFGMGETQMNRRMEWATVFVGLLVTAGCHTAPKAEPKAAADAGPFARTTVDLGVVVSDLDQSAKFYTEVVGFKEVKGFNVPATMGADSGLTDGGEPVTIRVFKLGDDETATKLKLMQFHKAKSKASDEQYIHSTLGYSYITIFVKDVAPTEKRARAAGHKPLAKSPTPLPKGFPEGIYLMVIRDPDGNVVEIVGPKPGQ